MDAQVDDVLEKKLAARLGPANLQRRIERQASHRAHLHHQGEGLLVLERALPIDRMIERFFRGIGLHPRGNRNFLNIRLSAHTVASPRLPEAFDGFRILHLTDLHLDLDTRLTGAILSSISGLDYDLAVITGDFSNDTRGHSSVELAELARIIPHLQTPCYGVLGNHDFIEVVPEIEALGVRLLLNESVPLERDGARIDLIGIDDPHFYRTHSLSKACRGLPEGGYRILLAHSPEIYAEAEPHADLVLSGHTHGGQICLPGGFAPVRNARCPAALLKGSWRHGRLAGYTSRGTGCSGVALRFNCPAEICVHTLRRAGP